MQKGYRIISIGAAEIYKNEQEYGVAVGYKMPKIKSDAYFRLFRNYLNYAERAERESSGVEGAVDADSSGSKYGYGKGD